MKKLLPRSLLLSGVLLLGACSTVNTRIQQNAAVFNTLDPATQAKISHGDVDLGFTPTMVYMALGQPDVKRHRLASDGETEQWIYRSYYPADAGPYVGGPFFGYHRWYAPYHGFYRVYWEPAYIDYDVPQDDIRVTFRNGRVIMIDQART